MRRFGVLLVVVVATAFASTAGNAKAGLITGLLGGNCGVTAPVFAPLGRLGELLLRSERRLRERVKPAGRSAVVRRW